MSWAPETVSWLSVKVIPKLKILGEIYHLPLFLNGEVVKKNNVLTGIRFDNLQCTDALFIKTMKRFSMVLSNVNGLGSVFFLPKIG